MTSVIVFAVLNLAISSVSYVAGSLEESLKYWETLSNSNIKRRITKRDTASQHPAEQQISFDSYNRHFSLLLRKDLSVLSPDLKILVFEENGASNEVHLDLNIYRGIVQGDVRSSVNAYYNGNQTLTATIQTDSDLFVIEPESNLNPDATNDSMIIYRESDVIWDNRSRCGFVNEDLKKRKPDTNQLPTEKTQRTRSKRSLCTNTKQNTCLLYLAADTRFYRYVGRNDVTETAARMLTVIDTVDSTYRRHKFAGCDTGFGFEVSRVHIFPQTTTGYPYTSDEDFGINAKLSAFTADPSLKDVCLGHLFTYTAFGEGGGYVLGLAYISSPDPDSVGGICSNSDATFNVGWTTYLSYAPVTFLQTIVVTTHELGHNWGSPHDTESAPGCTYNSSLGGNFIMYPIAVSGLNPNNKNFSPCSRNAIGRVLATKAGCFIEKQAAFCGNFRIDPGEECDGGYFIGTDGDKCCTSSCKLRPGATCSDMNHRCCLNCQVRPDDGDYVCFPTDDEICQLSSKCDGKSFKCPTPANKPDGAPCINKGKCKAGVCQNLCQLKNFTSICSCDSEKNYCKMCCRNSRGICAPPLFDETHYELLPPGTGCRIGICDDNGVCLASSVNPVIRLWEILDLTSPNAVVKFMRNNIVWTIVILSLLIWIPVSCIVCAADRKAKKERVAYIHEAVDEIFDEMDEIKSPSTVPSPTSVEPVGGSTQRLETVDGAKPDSTAPTPPPSVESPEKRAQQQKQQNDVNSIGTVGKPTPQRYAGDKESIKNVVRRMTLQMLPSDHSSISSGKDLVAVKPGIKRKVADG